MEYLEIKTLEIAGINSALETLRLPFGKECRSNCTFNYRCDNKDTNTFFAATTGAIVDKNDIELLSTLIERGDEHAKAVRLINVYVNITAPRYWWQEMVTYEVGVTKGCSNSTMHQECKRLSEEELISAKEELSEGTLQTRTYMISYQTLRRIYLQRKDHRLPHWREFCEWIETLPFAKELIINNVL